NSIKKVIYKYFLRVDGYHSGSIQCVYTGGNQRLYFGPGIKLTVETKQEESPQFYKLNDKKNICLATGFTKKDATDTILHGPEPVLFSGKSYYSRILKDYGDCENSTTPCDENDLDSGFDVNAKTKFLTLSLFWLRVLFCKTIAFNILMTLKVWMS
uniref:T-cell receptor alpha joining 14 n=1 Tax=Pygocentrus nattereri TaxID=42514 RepID=A0AAR2J4D6_PYGNA